MDFQSKGVDAAHKLTDGELQSFEDNGCLHVENVFSEDEIESLRTTVDEYIDEWVLNQYGWEVGWRSSKLDPGNREVSSIIQFHDLHFLSVTFTALVQDPRLVTPAAQIVGQDLELHHSSLAAVLPHEGDPFPLHQDNVFYPHENQRYVEVLVHLDDVDREMGPVLMAEGSHRSGPIEHVKDEDGNPRIPQSEYTIEDTVEIPAAKGDVIFHSIWTAHSAAPNLSTDIRRLVQIDLKDPANQQFEGRAHGRENIMVSGEKSLKRRD